MRRFLAWVAAVAALGSGPLTAQTGRPGAVLDLVPDPTSPSTLYASTSGGGVFRSDDAGRHWGRASIVPGGDAFQMTVSGSPTFLLAATAGGLWRSDDRGTAWVRSDSGLASPPVLGVAASPTDSTVLYAIASARLGRSLDQAHGWLPAGAGLPPILVTSVASAADPRIAYAAVKEVGPLRTPREGIYKTADGGATWVQTAFQPLLSTTHYASDLFVDPTSSDTVFAPVHGMRGILLPLPPAGPVGRRRSDLESRDDASVGRRCPRRPLLRRLSLDGSRRLVAAAHGERAWSPAGFRLAGVPDDRRAGRERRAVLVDGLRYDLASRRPARQSVRGRRGTALSGGGPVSCACRLYHVRALHAGRRPRLPADRRRRRLLVLQRKQPRARRESGLG